MIKIRGKITRKLEVYGHLGVKLKKIIAKNFLKKTLNLDEIKKLKI